MNEQRRVLRKNTSLKGQILIDGSTPMPCILANVSTTGAKINLAHQTDLPDTFHLMAADLDLDVQAKVVWHRDEQVGVRFLRRSAA